MESELLHVLYFLCCIVRVSSLTHQQKLYIFHRQICRNFQIQLILFCLGLLFLFSLMIHAGLMVSGMVFYLITIGFSFKSDQDIDSALIWRWPSSSHFSLRDILLFTPVEHLRDGISLICLLPFIFVFHLAFNHFPDICSLLLYSVPLTK